MWGESPQVGAPMGRGSLPRSVGPRCSRKTHRPTRAAWAEPRLLAQTGALDLEAFDVSIEPPALKNVLASKELAPAVAELRHSAERTQQGPSGHPKSANGWDKSEPVRAFPHSDVLQGLRIRPEQPTRFRGLIPHHRNRHNSTSRLRHRSCPSKNPKKTDPKRVRLLKLTTAQIGYIPVPRRGVEWRREGDSNPRRLAPQRFSRPSQSSALPSLHSPP